MKDITQQKQTALKVYSMLKLADPDCLLAGGAPRDWYFNNTCNDLDFYFCSTASTMGSTRKQLEALGFSGVKHITNPYTSELYRCMDGLVRIWECVVDEMKVQLIQLAEPKYRWKVVDNMDVSICKACFLSNGEIKLHKDFKLTIASGVMFTKENYSWGDKHPSKMKERFIGSFVCGTKQQAEQAILTRALDSFNEN